MGLEESGKSYQWQSRQFTHTAPGTSMLRAAEANSRSTGDESKENQRQIVQRWLGPGALPSVVVHTYNPSTAWVETGGSQV